MRISHYPNFIRQKKKTFQHLKYMKLPDLKKKLKITVFRFDTITVHLINVNTNEALELKLICYCHFSFNLLPPLLKQ